MDLARAGRVFAYRTTARFLQSLEQGRMARQLERTGEVILLADDSEDDEVIFKRVLRLSGLTNPVAVVRNGEEAIAYLKGEGPFADRERFPMPRILMLDLKMPRKDGFEVLQWLRAEAALKHLLVVVLTIS